jgi:hypothetical protein
LAAARGLFDGRERELTKWLPSGAPERLKIDEFRQRPQNLQHHEKFQRSFGFHSHGDISRCPDGYKYGGRAGRHQCARRPISHQWSCPKRTQTPSRPSTQRTTPSGTNAAAVPAGMSALDPVGLHGTNAAAGPAGMNTATRAMSLEDCIQEALQHNLDVQIERYRPQIQLYNLRGAYGGYDPLLNLSGQHNYNDTGRRGRHIPPTISDVKFRQIRHRRVAAVGHDNTISAAMFRTPTTPTTWV